MFDLVEFALEVGLVFGECFDLVSELVVFVFQLEVEPVGLHQMLPQLLIVLNYLQLCDFALQVHPLHHQLPVLFLLTLELGSQRPDLVTQLPH